MSRSCGRSSRASYLKYSKLEHVDARRRGPAPDHPRSASHAGVSRRRRSRSRRWPTFRPAPGSARPAASRPRCSRPCTRTAGGCCIPQELAELACEIEIDRLGEPVGKQDQYIAAYGGITCFTFNADDSRRRRPLPIGDARRCTSWRTTCCCSSLASREAPARSSRTRTSARRHRRGDDREPALRQGPGPAQPKRARARRHRRLRRVDARALGAQEAALGRHEQPADRRVVRAGPQERRAGRQAGRRRRRRLPDVLLPKTAGGCAARCRAPGWKRSGSASISRARKSCCPDGISH